jgi:hypothetical protein
MWVWGVVGVVIVKLIGVIIIGDMIRTCTRIVRFAIGVTRVDLTPKELRNNNKIDFVNQLSFSTQ